MQEKAKSITLLTHIILSCLMRSGANLQCSALGSELLEQVNTAKYHTASLSWAALSPWLSVPSLLWTFHKAQNRDDYVKTKSWLPVVSGMQHLLSSLLLGLRQWRAAQRVGLGFSTNLGFQAAFPKGWRRSAHDRHHSAVKLMLQAQLRQCSSFPWQLHISYSFLQSCFLFGGNEGWALGDIGEKWSALTCSGEQNLLTWMWEDPLFSPMYMFWGFFPDRDNECSLTKSVLEDRKYKARLPIAVNWWPHLIQGSYSPTPSQNLLPIWEPITNSVPVSSISAQALPLKPNKALKSGLLKVPQAGHATPHTCIGCEEKYFDLS